MSTNPQYVPPRKSHVLRNVIIAAVILFVLMIGGCVALMGLAANEVDKSITKHETQVGGTNNPMEITLGKAFNVRGFSYAAGWRLKNNELGDLDLTGLTVTNTRDHRDSAIVEIKIWKGNEVTALADCTTEPMMPNTSTKLNCTSIDTLPKKYTRITINDSF